MTAEILCRDRRDAAHGALRLTSYLNSRAVGSAGPLIATLAGFATFVFMRASPIAGGRYL